MAMRKLGGSHPNYVKGKYDKLIASIILSGKKLKAFPMKSGRRQGCLLSMLPFNTMCEILTRATRQEKETKEIQIEKEIKNHPNLEMI
jgi:hypothetical protein